MAAALVLPAHAASATILQRVRQQGFVRCGSAIRPGLATQDGAGRWSGLNVDICRAVAAAVFGRSASFAFRAYGSARDYDAVRAGDDEVSFLSFSEMAEQGLTDKLLPGPTVFVETHQLLVPADSPARHPGDLAGQSICFIIAAAPNDSLDAWFADQRLPIIHFPFREDGEMYDAYNVQRCKAVVGESTALADARLDGGVNHLKSRFLPDPLTAFPIMAATPLGGDAQWAAIVADTVATLVVADTPETPNRAGGVRAMTVEGEGLGLAAGWQTSVLDVVGSYAAIFRRTLGAASPLKLEPGLNAPLTRGGIQLTPFRD